MENSAITNLYVNDVLNLESLALSRVRKHGMTRDKSGAYKIPAINEVFGSKDRLIYNFDADYDTGFSTAVDQSDSSYNKVSDFLIKRGFKKPSIKEYIDGQAKIEGDKNPYKIGRILNKAASEQPKAMNRKDELEPEFSMRFRDDQIRHIQNPELAVVFSRHPYDIYGMSTDRMWTSCMNLSKKDADGNNTSFIPKEVEMGTLIAYLTPRSEVTESGKVALKKPVSRVLLKPMYNADGELGYAISKAYGGMIDSFLDVVKDWSDVNFNDKVKDLDGFALADGVYEDPYETGKLKEADPDKVEIRKMNHQLQVIKTTTMNRIPADVRQNMVVNAFVDDDFLTTQTTVSFNFPEKFGTSPFTLKPTDPTLQSPDMMYRFGLTPEIINSPYFVGLASNPTVNNVKLRFTKEGDIKDATEFMEWVRLVPAKTLTHNTV